MNEDDLEKQLETIRKQTSQEELIQFLLDYLNHNLGDEKHEILEVWLQTNSLHDERVIAYWKKILESDDPWRQEVAASNLLIKCLSGSILACNILQEFLGMEPSFETLNNWRINHLGLDKFENHSN